MTGSPPEKPNLDLIQMVQRARMMHDAEARPSAVGGVYWIESKPQTAVAPPTERAGSWCITTPLAQVDAIWERIKYATEEGTLGYKSKVSTAPSPNQVSDDTRLILVCTCDADDMADVERVRQALDALGIEGAMRYERR